MWIAGESVSHIIYEYKKTARTEYKGRHGNIARVVHWEKRALDHKYSKRRKQKEHDKIEKYQDFKRKVAIMGPSKSEFYSSCSWYIWIRNKGSAQIKKESRSELKNQKMALLGTAKTLRKLLESWV